MRTLNYHFDWPYFIQCHTSFSAIDHHPVPCVQFLMLFHLIKVLFMKSITIFWAQTTLFKWLSFLLVSLTMILKVLLFWIYFYLISLASTLQWLSLNLEILIIMMSVFIAFPLNLRGQAPCHHKAFNYFCANWYIYEIFHERISLTVEFLLLFPKFRKGTGQNWCIYSS